jgi:hypothetical protein
MIIQQKSAVAPSLMSHAPVSVPAHCGSGWPPPIPRTPTSLLPLPPQGVGPPDMAVETASQRVAIVHHENINICNICQKPHGEFENSDSIS